MVTYRVIRRLAYEPPIADRAKWVPRTRTLHVLKECLLIAERSVIALWTDRHREGEDRKFRTAAIQGPRYG